jgi:hypothetical protein
MFGPARYAGELRLASNENVGGDTWCLRRDNRPYLRFDYTSPAETALPAGTDYRPEAGWLRSQSDAVTISRADALQPAPTTGQEWLCIMSSPAPGLTRSTERQRQKDRVLEQRGSYLKKSLDRNTTGLLVSAGSSKNLRAARSSIASRSRTN